MKSLSTQTSSTRRGLPGASRGMAQSISFRFRSLLFQGMAKRKPLQSRERGEVPARPQCEVSQRPLPHLVEGVSEVFPANVHDQGLGLSRPRTPWTPQKRSFSSYSTSGISEAIKCLMRRCVRPRLWELTRRKTTSAGIRWPGDEVVEPPLRSSRSYSPRPILSTFTLVLVDSTWPLLNSSRGAAFIGVMGGWSPTSRPVFGFRICPWRSKWLTVFPQAGWSACSRKAA